MPRAFSFPMTVVALLLVCFTSSAAPPTDDPVVADPQPRWFKGNLHTHSLWSDGNDYPEMIADWYRRHGYHFLALSDHNILSQGQQWISVARGQQAGQAGRLRPLPQAVRGRLGRDPHGGRRPPGPPQAPGRVPGPAGAARPLPDDPGRGDHRPVREEADPHERQQPAGTDQAPGRPERRGGDDQRPGRRRGAGPAAGAADPGTPQSPELRLCDHRRGVGAGDQGAVLRGLQRPSRRASPGRRDPCRRRADVGHHQHAAGRRDEGGPGLRPGDRRLAQLLRHGWLVAGPGLGHGAGPPPDARNRSSGRSRRGTSTPPAA